MSAKKTILPAKPLGILALVVAGSMIANRLHGLMIKTEAKVKQAAANATGKVAA